MPNPDSGTTELRRWFDAYLDGFAALATGPCADVDLILGYYGVPLVLVTEQRTLVLPTPEAVMTAVTAIITQLRHADYGSSTTHRLTIHPLNARAVLIEGVFSRHNRAGQEFEHFDATYLVLMTDAGWRMGSIVITAT